MAVYVRMRRSGLECPRCPPGGSRKLRGKPVANSSFVSHSSPLENRNDVEAADYEYWMRVIHYLLIRLFMKVGRSDEDAELAMP